MGDPYIGEIRAFPFTFAPYGWSTCDGQTLQIQQNSALFAVIGPAYGGNGTTTFCLPNLSGRAPMAAGNGPGLTPRSVAQQVGSAAVSLATNNFPPHSHGFNACNTNGVESTPANNYLAKGGLLGRQFIATNTYLPQSTAGTQLAADAVQSAGTAPGNVSHNNMQPYLPVMLCIAVMGIFPARQ